MYQGEQTFHSKHRYCPLCWAVSPGKLSASRRAFSAVRSTPVIAHYIGLFSGDYPDCTSSQCNPYCYCPLYRAVFRLYSRRRVSRRRCLLLPTISGCFPESKVEAEARRNKGNGVIAHYIGLFSSSVFNTFLESYHTNTRFSTVLLRKIGVNLFYQILAKPHNYAILFSASNFAFG